MMDHILLLLSLNPCRSEAELEQLLTKIIKMYVEHGGNLETAKAIAQGIKQ